jgi:hypothetical protein
VTASENKQECRRDFFAFVLVEEHEQLQLLLCEKKIVSEENHLVNSTDICVTSIVDVSQAFEPTKRQKENEDTQKDEMR